MSKSNIVRPVTADGMVGYDGFGQFVLTMLTKHGRVTTHIADVREKTCAICTYGWAPTGLAMEDQHRWGLIDDFVHRSCLVRHMGFVERAEISDAIYAARIRHHGLRVRENGYSCDEWARPWYYAELIDFPVRLDIGWRKRVISIELRPQGGTELEWWSAAQDVFADESSTKDFGADLVLLHAWGYEKAKDYLKRLAAFVVRPSGADQ